MFGSSIQSFTKGDLLNLKNRSKDMTLSLVVPFYNEEKSIREVVRGLFDTFERSSIDYELILVNNGSTDKTPQILEDLAREKPDTIKVVHVSINQGYGWGIINGLKRVSGEYIGFMDGDGQIKSSDVLKVYSKLVDENLDLCLTKRVAREDGLARKFISYCYNFIFRFLFSLNAKDINATPKIMRREIYEKLDLVSKGWFLDAEVVIKCTRMNCKIGEASVTFHKRKAGKSYVNFCAILEFLKNMIRYRLGPFESGH